MQSLPHATAAGRPLRSRKGMLLILYTGKGGASKTIMAAVSCPFSLASRLWSGDAFFAPGVYTEASCATLFRKGSEHPEME